MNIWLVQIGEPLPTETESKKLRTAILADKLIEKGHSVLSFVSAFDHFKKKWIYQKDTEIKLNPNYSLRIIRGSGYKKNISLQRLIDHRIISNKFKKLAPLLLKPDIIVASMPPHDLSYQVVRFANQNHIPVLVDIRDPWPDIFIQSFPKMFAKFFKLFLYKEFFFVRKTMQLADGLLATTSTLLQWGLCYAGRHKSEKDKVFYLGHKKNISLNEKEISTGLIEDAKKINGKFIVFFIGTVANYHNPLILVEVAKKLIQNQNIHLVIAGTGELFNELKRQSENLSNITLTGWLNNNEIEFWLQRSKVGLCTTPKLIDLLPNKTGTYLSAGLPIIEAFQGDLKEIIEKHKIGFYYPPNDASELANCILKLYENKSLYQTMSENAKKIFDEMFDANKIYEEYANHVETLAARLGTP